jgi:hypothetical protein
MIAALGICQAIYKAVRIVGSEAASKDGFA